MKPKTRKCKYCSERYTPKHSSLEPCWKYECRLKHLEANTAKINRANKATAKEKIKSYSQRLQEAKKVFQKWVRVRDKGLPCISCGTVKCNEWAGGHYFKAETYTHLIFDERNCHKQCNAYCNKHRDGAQAEYRIGLVNRYGEAYVKGLEDLAMLKQQRKYTNQEIEDIKTKYKT
jgi:hypothetical protein